MEAFKSAFGMNRSQDSKAKKEQKNQNQIAEEIRVHQQAIRELAKMCEEMGLDTWSDAQYLQALKMTKGNNEQAIQLLLEQGTQEQIQYEEPQAQMQQQSSKGKAQNNVDFGGDSQRRQQPGQIVYDPAVFAANGNNPNGMQKQKSDNTDEFKKQQLEIQQRLQRESQTEWQQSSGQWQSNHQRSHTTALPNQQNQRTQPNQKISYEPIPANERYRDETIPSGLKNIGNTCYFASLMQVFFHLPNIQEKILTFNTNNSLNRIDIDTMKEMDQVAKIKIKSSRELVKNIQYMFSMMLLSNVKYQDPTKVLESIVDDNGIGLSIYEQKDIGEFFLNFLERMQDGLGENKAMIRKLMGKDLNDATRASVATKSTSAHGSERQESINEHLNPQDSERNLMDLQKQIKGYGKSDQQNDNQVGADAFSEDQKNDYSHGSIKGMGQNEYEQHMDKMIGEHQKIGNQEDNSLYGAGAPSQSFFMRQQSMMDPDKSQALLNYDLDEFKNSMWENFLGSQVQISKTVEADGSYKITNQNVDKMGPIQLRIEEDNLYQAWEKSRRSEIEGFKGDNPGQTKQVETWLCRPPNVMMFQLNRVNYDMKKNKLVKDNSRFDFDKEIYLDLFLNQNKERSDKHRAELEKKKKTLKGLKETYHLLTVQNDIVQKFQACQEFIAKNSSKDNQTLSNSIMVDGNEFAHLDVNKLHQTTLGITNAEIKTTQAVLSKFKESAQVELDNLKYKIEILEKQCEQPYVKNKERPYQLHAIMIHDGLAENGHYYSYVYDRIQKCWWQLNDHKTFKVDEAQVMKEALGDAKKYKSACNLFYISQRIASEIDSKRIPLYTKEHANLIPISKEIRDEIHLQNCKFEIESQNEKVKLYVQKIHNLVKERLNIIENQSINLEQIVQLKLYSFAHFLKLIEFKGYAKWTILNQAVKEEHPQKMSIADINKGLIEENGTPGAARDEIYEGLLAHYADKFMSLTPQETKSIQNKQSEYKSLLKKSVYLTYMFINMNVQKISEVLNVFATFKMFCTQLNTGIQYYNRISDFDNIAIEIIQIFILNLIINMYMKYRSSSSQKRKEAQQSAQLASIMLVQFFDKKKPHFKQFERALEEIALAWHKYKNRNIEGAENEYEFWTSLAQKMKKSQFQENELFVITAQQSDLPKEILDEFTKIDEIDCMAFVDGIDIEHCSYKYYNSLNHFRYQNSGQINLQNNLVMKAPLSESNFNYQIEKFKIQIDPQQIDFSDFNIAKILGRQSNLAPENAGPGLSGATMRNNYIE